MVSSRNDVVMIFALLISVALHAVLFWRAPMEKQSTFQAPSGQPMAVTLGAPTPPKTVEPKPVAQELITTQAQDAQIQIAKEPEIIEPEPIPEPELKKPDVVSALEELIVTREVQLSSRPIPPVYPDKARRDRQEGLVLVRAQVNEQGKTLAVKVAKSSGFPLLDKAALEAVSQWSFMPAQQNDQAIMAWIEVPIDFKLR